MERAIGEIFEIEGEKMKVVESYCGCEGCCLKGHLYCNTERSVRGRCDKNNRIDGMDVIFELLEE